MKIKLFVTFLTAALLTCKTSSLSLNKKGYAQTNSDATFDLGGMLGGAATAFDNSF